MVCAVFLEFDCSGACKSPATLAQRGTALQLGGVPAALGWVPHVYIMQSHTTNSLYCCILLAKFYQKTVAICNLPTNVHVRRILLTRIVRMV